MSIQRMSGGVNIVSRLLGFQFVGVCGSGSSQYLSNMLVLQCCERSSGGGVLNGLGDL